MKFEPKKETEVNANNLLPPGQYDFEVMEATDAVSAAGNEMIKMKLGVFDANGARRVIFDYLLESIAYKLRHAAYACGLGKQYESGLLEAIEFNGQCGKLKLKIDVSKDPAYSDKNAVVDYITTELTPKQKAKQQEDKSALEKEEIPF